MAILGNCSSCSFSSYLYIGIALVFFCFTSIDLTPHSTLYLHLRLLIPTVPLAVTLCPTTLNPDLKPRDINKATEKKKERKTQKERKKEMCHKMNWSHAPCGYTPPDAQQLVQCEKAMKTGRYCSDLEEMPFVVICICNWCEYNKDQLRRIFTKMQDLDGILKDAEQAVKAANALNEDVARIVGKIARSVGMIGSRHLFTTLRLKFGRISWAGS